MSKAGLTLILLLGAACQPPPSASSVAGGPVNPDPGVRLYRCEDGRTVEAGYPDDRSAVIKLDGRPYPLQAQAAASGVRFVGFGLQWWTKGMDEARLARLKNGETIAHEVGVLCRTSASDVGEGPKP